MTTDFELDLTLTGTEQQLRDMLAVVTEYATRGNRDAWFDFVTVRRGETSSKINDELTCDETIEMLVEGGGSVEVSALGPFGKYDELRDVALFNELAESAPQASFVGSVKGDRGSMEESLVCRLENGVVSFRQEMADNDEIEEAYRSHFAESISAEEFAEWFGIGEDVLDEDSYWDLLYELVICNSDALHELPYDEFVNCLDNAMVEAAVDEDVYAAAIEKVKARELESFNMFREAYESDVTEWTYNPVTREIADAKG